MPESIHFLMQNGDFLNPEIIEKALDAMESGSAAPPVELSALTLVDEFLTDPSLPPTQRLRDFAVQHLLTELIKACYARHRRFHFDTDIPQNAGLKQHIQLIREDAATRSAKLIGWTVLYYRYVCVEFEFSLEELTKIPDRTLRRYRKAAIQEFNERLVYAEWEARNRFRKRRLYAALPAVTPARLIGKRQAWDEAQGQGTHLLITGPPGCGKTTFVQEVVRHLIDDGLQQLIWINHPDSLETVYRFVEERIFQRQQYSIKIREYCLMYRVAIVIDDTSQLTEEDLDHLLDMFEGTSVYLVNSTALKLRHLVKHLPLRNLHGDEITDYLQTLRVETDKTAQTMIERITGGNPLAIKLVIHALDKDLTAGKDLHELFDYFYHRLPVSMRRVWVAFTLIPEAGLRWEQVVQLWPESKWDDVQALLLNYLLEKQDDGRLVLPAAAFQFLNLRRKTDSETAALFGGCLRQVIDLLKRQPDAELIEHLLALDLLTEIEWLKMLLAAGVKSQSRWYAILNKLYDRTPFDFELLMAYGQSLRRYAKWDDARKIFHQAAVAAGRSGLFIQQAQAFLEEAVIWRSIGRYEDALKRLDSVLSTAKRLRDAALLNSARLEQAQIMIDLKEAETALKLLQMLPETGRTLALQAEACLLAGYHTNGLHTAFKALASYQDDRFNLGKLYILLGRLFLANGNFQNAGEHFSAAISILEIEDDAFALARTQMNLGITYLQQQQYGQAMVWLERARAIQAQIHDLVGLAVTEHNIALTQNAL